VTVTAVGQNGSTDGLFAGTVHFSTSDTVSGVKVPGDYSFTTAGPAADTGAHTFSGGVTLQTGSAAGTAETITVTDTATGVTGSATVKVILCPSSGPCPPAPPTGLNVTVQ